MVREDFRLDTIEACAPPGTFAPESAGSAMTEAFIAIAPNVIAAHAIEGLRQIAEQADTRSYVYVVDPDGELHGVLSFHDLVFADPGTPVAALMIRTVKSVPAAIPLDEAAHLLRDSGLLALPVLGVIGALWSGKVEFGIVIGGAMICSMITAGFMGTMVPMISKKLGFDPAATAGPFETAFQDVVGFAVYLWLASLMIGYLT
jgi:Mg/Co/Ni transporter MgtE